MKRRALPGHTNLSGLAYLRWDNPTALVHLPSRAGSERGRNIQGCRPLQSDEDARRILLGSRNLACVMAIAFFVAGRESVATAAAEGSSVGHGEGGYVPDFVAIVRRYNASGEPFRIEGNQRAPCSLASAMFALNGAPR